jgi:hypothetical protein
VRRHDARSVSLVLQELDVYQPKRTAKRAKATAPKPIGRRRVVHASCSSPCQKYRKQPHAKYNTNNRNWSCPGLCRTNPKKLGSQAVHPCARGEPVSRETKREHRASAGHELVDGGLRAVGFGVHEEGDNGEGNAAAERRGGVSTISRAAGRNSSSSPRRLTRSETTFVVID